jgi:hypothetical protein
MHEFDNLRRGIDPSVFVSEYAVTSDGGWGNLKVRCLTSCVICFSLTLDTILPLKF